MKKLLHFCLLVTIFFVTNAENGENEVNPDNINLVLEQDKIPRSFMFTRPIYRTIVAQQSLWHDTLYGNGCAYNHGFQIIPMYQHSVSTEKSQKYFLFKDQETLTVKGDAIITGNPSLRDVRAEWLGLSNTFDGNFSVDPRQQQWALWLEGRIEVKEFLTHPFFETFWLGFSAPIHFVQNNITISQTVKTPSTGTVTDIIKALNQQSWDYAKFSPTKESRSGLGEIFLKLGTRFLDHDDFQLGTYSGLVIPVRGQQNPEFVFSPFIGNNRHFGYAFGGTLQLPLNCSCSSLVALYVEMENIYFFRHQAFRTLDLRFKPWSRYLLINNINGTTNIPGVNILTRNVCIHPYNMFDLATGIRIQWAGIEAEVGYELWAHGKERLLLEHDEWPEGVYGIAGDGALVPGTNIPATSSHSTINIFAGNDLDSLGNPTFVAIKRSELDFLSGGSAHAISHRATVDIGYQLERCTYDLFFGCGGFYEISQWGTSLNNWGIWVKFGGSL